jgi:ATP-dependent Clp protease ATP-binding subunit ClpA
MLCEAGYDPRYGARPLQHAIEQMVVTPLARLLVDRPTLKNVTLTVGIDESGKVAFVLGE